MSEPTTEAGRALLRKIVSEMGYFTADPTDRAEVDKYAELIAEAEAEAATNRADTLASVLRLLLDAADNYAEQGGVLAEWNDEDIVIEARGVDEVTDEADERNGLPVMEATEPVELNDEYIVPTNDHVLDATCWCQPTKSYGDSASGTQVWTHKGEQA